MIRALILDDENSNTDNLAILLNKYCESINQIEVAHSAKEARLKISSQPIDLLFLDIQMPKEDGFAFLKSLGDIQFEIIFVTAHDIFGIQAAKFSAIDYLLKPVLIPDLIEAVKKATRRIEQKKENISLKGLLQYLNNANKAEQKIALPLMNETRLIEVKDIIRVESKNVYSYFYIQNEERLVISKPLKFYEELLNDYGFIRIHQSHLVNKGYIKGLVTKDGLFVILKDNTQIPVARQRKETVKKFLLK